MKNSNFAEIEVITVNSFNFLYIKEDPPRLEVKVVFDKDNISQKLIFTIMNITYNHGFSCSAPIFFDVEDPSLTFIIGTILPSARFKKKYIDRLLACLIDITEFYNEFINQLDFSRLDLTMFSNIDLSTFYPEQIAAVRDQHYGGSWDKFHEAMDNEQRLEEIEVIEKCREFEEINKKDIGFVGHKLAYVLNILDESLGNNFEMN